MVACALALALGLTLLHLLYNYSRLKSIPGPFLARFTDLWRAHARNSTGYGQSLAELHQRYGSIVRLGPNAVSISDIEDIAGVYRAVSAEELSWRRPNPSPDGDVVFQGEGAIDESLRSIVAAIRRHGTLDLASSLCRFAEDFVSDIDSMPWLQHSSHLPHWRDIAGLTYLDAVMKETMRHTLLQNDQEIRLPTASLGVRHLRVLSDTTMSWHPHVVLCSRSVYGDDALTFRPERWLVEDPRHRKLMNDSLLPFQVYGESHPEVELVWLELKKAVVVLLREFDLMARVELVRSEQT
ncbi:cytochrome P450 [Aspergillus egyptiacus]|nr:cytochrome P450 [Aspergillus egyptiacus]